MTEKYRTFIDSYIPFKCLLHGMCCTHFGGDGPRVKIEEKDEVINALNKENLEEIADHVLRYNSIPAEGPTLERKCLMYNENTCKLHNTAKPQVCRDYPIFITEKKGLVEIEIDNACESIKQQEYEQKYLELKTEFKKTFNKELFLIFTNSAYERKKRYL